MRAARLFTVVAAGACLAASAQAQEMEVRAEQPRATIGDPIILRVTVRLPPGMELIDVVPRTLVPPPRGIRLLKTDTLRPIGNGTLTGKSRVAFYRIGVQPVPTLALLYRASPGEPPDTLLHLPVSVEITPTLEAGNPPLRDIKPLRLVSGPLWGPVAMLAVLIGGAFLWLRRRARGRVPPSAEPRPALAIGPFDVALARLLDIEQAARASGNGVIPTYTGVAAVLRDCLLAVGAIPHQGLTTPELGSALPSLLADGDLRQQCESLLGEADLVKFAAVRPDLPAAGRHVGRARTLVEAWRAAARAVDWGEA